MFSDIVHLVRVAYDASAIEEFGTVPKYKKKREKNEYVERIKTLPNYGDVVYCDRAGGVYGHFGIYVGGRKVIHFADPQGEFSTERAVVHEISLERFVDGCRLYRMIFPQKYSSDSVLRKLIMSGDYVLYSPEETVRRARSKLGKRGVRDDGYNLIMNNCEDFAIWCKTGVFESRQVNALIDCLLP